MWGLALLCLVAIAYVLVCVVLHHCRFCGRRQTSKSSDDVPNLPLRNIRAALIVTAHPDDECMFFGPTLLKLVDSCPRVYLLCLSSGNYHGLAKIRKLELQDSCRKLGLDPSNVLVVSHTRLPDDSAARWDKWLVAKIVLRHVDIWDVDTLITFGRCGVSGHDNHRAIHRAVQHLYSTKQLPAKCRAFTLDDVNVLRKYLGIFDVPLTHLLSKYVYVSTPVEVISTKEAMAAHGSQMVWFRKLYCAFSRYMVVNSLTPVVDVDDFDDSDDDVFLR